jgi:XapX domain-containing protein
MIKQGILALVVGMGLGVITTWLKLPLPAPTSIIGIVAIFGIWLGYMVTTLLV